MISARAATNLVAAAGVAGALTLYRFPPQEYSFYPRCPFYALTHLYCPGCGATRAIAELLHGHLAAAFHFNAGIILLLPVLLWYFGKMYCAAMWENRVQWPKVPQWSLSATVACTLLFAVIRNIAVF
ncbi:MAG TPA: DUF2752 domain-containing protein [Candidatus Acidoferrum sp.]|jgi:hypothetical protein